MEVPGQTGFEDTPPHDAELRLKASSIITMCTAQHRKLLEGSPARTFLTSQQTAVGTEVQ